jgi:hypothetical protein
MKIRIVRARFKMLFVLGWFISSLPYEKLFGIVLPTVVGIIVGQVLTVGFIAVGVRAFRGQDEEILPPRIWWRLTANPTAGFVVCGLFGILASYEWVGAFAGSSADAVDVLTKSVGAPIDSFLFLAFLLSSVLLLRSRRRQGDVEARAA